MAAKEGAIFDFLWKRRCDKQTPVPRFCTDIYRVSGGGFSV